MMVQLISDPAYATGRRSFPRTVTVTDAADIADGLHHEVEAGTAARAKAMALQDIRLACHRGCAGCCEELVLVYRPESLTVARYLGSPAGAAARAAFVAGYPRWRDAVGDAPRRLADLLAAADRRYEEEHRVQWRRRVPCAFLACAQCTVYPVRPINCRTANAIDVSERCFGDFPGGQPASRVVYPMLDRYIARTTPLLRAAHNAVGGPRGRAEALCTAVALLLGIG